jgi:uncharacterized RDD family membrane protein YckC
MAWYYATDGQRRGPVSDEEFGDLVRRGVIAPDSLVWTAGMVDWRRLSEVAPELPPPMPARTDALGGAQGPALTGTAATFGRAVAEAGTAPRYAGFWLRVAARLIDGVLLWVAGQVVGGVLVALLIPDALGAFSIEPGAEPSGEQLATLLAVFGIVFFASLVTGLVYDLIFLKGWSATPGKLAMGLRIRTADGGPLTIGRIIGRHFAVSLSGLLMGIGYLMVAFDPEKRGLHDHFCATRVVRTR